MTALPPGFREDKALRDAAKKVWTAELDHFRASLAEQGIAGRIKAQITGQVKRRLGAGAREVFEQAKQQASDHRGVLALVIGALILWFAREPLAGALGMGEDAAPNAADKNADDPQGT